MDLSKIFDYERSVWGLRGDSAFKKTECEILEEKMNKNVYKMVPTNLSSNDFSKHMGNYDQYYNPN